VRVWGDTLTALRDLGARVEETRVPLDFEDLMQRNGRLIAAEAWAVHRAYIEDPALPVDPWVRQRVISGKAIGAADYIDELAARRRAAAQFARWMAGRDALLTPTLPMAAIPLADVDESTTPLAAFTRAANYLGACALSLPAGLSTEGLPIGMQLIGAPFTETKLVAIGQAFQRATDWHLRRPDLSAWK
jgi:aspartyl-tRNA(Asn)/glutamyl-tRNA(Gln) amidotransferase subunit A